MNDKIFHPPARTPAGTGLLTKAIDVLEMIAGRPGDIESSELAELTGIPKPTLYRILAALSARGLVRSDGHRHRYSLGYQIVEMAMNVWASSDLPILAATELRRLRDLSGETAYLAVMREGGVLSIARSEGAHTQRSAAQPGAVKPLHCTSQGKSILAYLPNDQRARLLPSPLERMTEKTITDATLLKLELARIRNRGFAIDDEEILMGTRCVGAPILDKNGAPVAAISVAGPTFRMTMERAEFLGKEVAAVAQQVSEIFNARTARTDLVDGHQALTSAPAFHGISPQWDAMGGRLVWADRFAPALFETQGETTRELAGFADPIRAVSVHPHWGTVVFFPDRIDFLDLSRSQAVTGTRVTTSATVGKTLWAGLSSPARHSALARIEASGQFGDHVEVPGPIAGVAVLNDEEIYLCLEDTGTIYHLHLPTRRLRRFAEIPRAAGQPVDLSVDGMGRLWLALKDGWNVVQLDEVGEIEASLPLPVRHPTGIACGGEDNRTLFVTSSRYELTQDDLTTAPLSGHLLQVHVR
ncbi:IclR family transcriptional regulator domain-containing protein [Oricola indica]|uniref:IclR family transcriptional regulator domain-containing protein n=1 Tax=Oricola indica TaxID=2872591 RepID=UPI001CBBB4CD